MEISELIQLIPNIGFPIFVSIYLLTYMNKQQEDMKETINELKNAINILTENLKNQGDKNGQE